MKMAGGVAGARGSSQGGLGGDGSTSSGPEVYCASIASTEESAASTATPEACAFCDISSAVRGVTPRESAGVEPGAAEALGGVGFPAGFGSGGKEGEGAEGSREDAATSAADGGVDVTFVVVGVSTLVVVGTSSFAGVAVSTFVGVGWSSGSSSGSSVGVGGSVPP